MYTVIASPTHVYPLTIAAPVLKDDLTGAYQYRRRLTRTLKKWEMTVAGTQERLETLRGLLAISQGDTPGWYDGSGIIEVVDPILIGIGNGTTTDFLLPDRYVFAASTIVYFNGGPTANWQPLGGDYMVMDQIRCSPAPAANVQITAKYRRKAKVVINTEADVEHGRLFRDQDNPSTSLYSIKLILSEMPN
jgi:hypothetical protein